LYFLKSTTSFSCVSDTRAMVALEDNGEKDKVEQLLVVKMQNVILQLVYISCVGTVTLIGEDEAKLNAKPSHHTYKCN